jgi:6-phosphogluconate dehydrogenase
MQIGVVGLGRMGGNIARRLQRNGHQCVIWNRDAGPVQAIASEEGATGASSFADMVQKLTDKPRAVWIMLPAGAITEQVIGEFAELLEPGDILIDGGNTMFKDDVRRAEALKPRGIRYVDVGTSGGVWGLERGYCLMIGGEKEAVDHIEPVLATLAPGKGNIELTPGRERHDQRAEQGYLHCGPVGAGHFVKMIHNGIEYGIMQAYAEGFDILKGANSQALPANQRYDFKLADIAELWRRGSVVSSWLLDLTAIALAEDAKLERFTGVVQDSGEGR